MFIVVLMIISDQKIVFAIRLYFILFFGQLCSSDEQQIWCDIGESEADKDRMLSDLERECLEVYRRKVNEAANTKARLHQSVATKEAELATLMAALGELNIQQTVPKKNQI